MGRCQPASPACREGAASSPLTSSWVVGAQEGRNGGPQNQGLKSLAQPHTWRLLSPSSSPWGEAKYSWSSMTTVAPPPSMPVGVWPGLWVPSTTLSKRKEDSAGAGAGRSPDVIKIIILFEW